MSKRGRHKYPGRNRRAMARVRRIVGRGSRLGRRLKSRYVNRWKRW